MAIGTAGAVVIGLIRLVAQPLRSVGPAATAVAPVARLTYMPDAASDAEPINCARCGGPEILPQLLRQREGEGLGGRGELLGLRVAPLVQESSTPITRSSGTEAPLVTPTLTDAGEPVLVDLAGVVDQVDARAPASSATSTSRTEFDEFVEPTTMTRSHSGAICLTTSWRFWVA